MSKKVKSISKKNLFWKELKKETRGQHNPKYKKKKDELLPGEIEFEEEFYEEPSDVTLDQAISHVVTAYGDVEIVFKEDATDEEMARIVEIFQSVM